LSEYRDPRVLVVRNPTRLGPAGARNVGLELAASPYVAFFDSDDVADPRRLEVQMAFFRRRADAGLLAARVAIVDEEGRPDGNVRGPTADPALLAPTLLFRNDLATSTIVAKRDVVGGERFDTSLPVASDYDMWLRVAN